MAAFDLAPMAARVAELRSMHYATDGRDILVNDPDGWEVERPWLWWAGDGGDSDGWGSGGPWGNPPPNNLGPFYGLRALPAVTRCTSLICDTIAGAPWPVRTGWDRLPSPDWIADPQALRIDQRVADPGRVSEVRLSAMEFWSQWILAALWLGDGFVYCPVRNDSDGSPRPPLWQLHPEKVDIEDDRYFVDDYELAPGSIIHLRGLPPYYQGRGEGVLIRHGADLGLNVSIRGYAQSTFRSGVPFGYLKVNAAGLKADQAQDLKAQWMRSHGRGRRSIAVLNSTVDFTPISINPIDAQLDRQREWGLRDIAVAFGVPAWFLGIPGDSSTYANVESRFIELRTFTELPWTRRVESTLDAQFPRGTEIKVNLDALMRADTKSRYDAYKIALDTGILTVDEVRALEDRPPLETGTLAQVDPSLPAQPIT
ncbi:MAG TPA: phage portal protein [Acidimicrobiales bacterium]|nr:phage portal protein [Acidimicrobiales bacterium]